MSVTHKLKTTWSDGGATLSAEVRQAGNVESNLDLTVPGGGFAASAVAITQATLQSFFLLSSQPATAYLNGADSVQVLTPSGAGAGDTFRLSWGGQTTAAIAFTATAAAVQLALAALSSIGAGNVAVTGPAGGPWRVEFVGALALAPRAAIAAGTYVTSTGASVAVAQAVVGAAATGSIALAAGVPVAWHKDLAAACPLAADVARVSIVVPGPATAAVQLRSIFN